MARRQVDDQPTDLAFPHRGQLGGDDLEMPVVSERRLRIELGKAALREKPEIRPKDRIVFGRRKARSLPGLPVFGSQPFPDARDDLVVRLGQRGLLGRAIRLSLDFLQQRDDKLRGLQISRCRFVDELSDDRFALGIFLRRPFSTTMTHPFRASLSKLDKFLRPRGRPLGLPDCPFWNRV